MKKSADSIHLLGYIFCFLLLSFSSLQSAAYSAPSSYYDTVQKIYIGYYQRPADPAGLIYWAERLDGSGGNLDEIIEAFADSAESQSLYGPINSGNISTVVNDIYNALYGRDAEAAGRDFYVNGFNTGQFTAATIMLNVLYGAQNEDLQSINNKAAAANLFTQTIDPELDGGSFQATYVGDADAIAGRNFLTLYSTVTAIPTQAETTSYLRAHIADPGDFLYADGGLAAVATSWTAGSPPELLGYKPFPASSPWYRDVSADPVDPDSDNIIADLVRDDPGTMLHPDFGSSLFEGIYVGHPYDVVAPSVTPMVHVAIGPDGYADESDPGPENAAARVPIPVPIPADVHIEGGYDHHIYILDKEGYWLYELYHAVQQTDGSWQADQVTLWDMNDNTRRPWTWTSADQAGLSIFAGLVKYDEVQAAIPGNGDIGHAVRFTVMPTQEPFIPPATHPGGGNEGTLHSPKMGQRFRLKAAWLAAHISEFSPQCQVILRSLARYGMILADTGSSLFIQGTRDARWVEDADTGGVAQLLRVPPQAFEVLAHDVEYTREDHPTGDPPSIAAFTATPSQAAGSGTATLNWTITGASTLIISPGVGPVRGSSITVRPAVTTTYTLFATNEYGRSRASVTVNVP